MEDRKEEVSSCAAWASGLVLETHRETACEISRTAVESVPWYATEGKHTREPRAVSVDPSMERLWANLKTPEAACQWRGGITNAVSQVAARLPTPKCPKIHGQAPDLNAQELGAVPRGATRLQKAQQEGLERAVAWFSDQKRTSSSSNQERSHESTSSVTPDTGWNVRAKASEGERAVPQTFGSQVELTRSPMHRRTSPSSLPLKKGLKNMPVLAVSPNGQDTLQAEPAKEAKENLEGSEQNAATTGSEARLVFLLEKVATEEEAQSQAADDSSDIASADDDLSSKTFMSSSKEDALVVSSRATLGMLPLLEEYKYSWESGPLAYLLEDGDVFPLPEVENFSPEMTEVPKSAAEKLRKFLRDFVVVTVVEERESLRARLRPGSSDSSIRDQTLALWKDIVELIGVENLEDLAVPEVLEWSLLTAFRNKKTLTVVKLGHDLLRQVRFLFAKEGRGWPPSTKVVKEFYRECCRSATARKSAQEAIRFGCHAVGLKGLGGLGENQVFRGLVSEELPNRKARRRAQEFEPDEVVALEEAALDRVCSASPPIGEASTQVLRALESLETVVVSLPTAPYVMLTESRKVHAVRKQDEGVSLRGFRLKAAAIRVELEDAIAQGARKTCAKFAASIFAR